MAAPQIAPAALAELRRLVKESSARRPVVSVSWERPWFDNKRGPDGETLWNRVSDGKWNVYVFDYENPRLPRRPDWPLTSVQGLEFVDQFFDPHGRELQRPLLDYEEGSFVLREGPKPPV